jgi:hypothetical protein
MRFQVSNNTSSSCHQPSYELTAARQHLCELTNKIAQDLDVLSLASLKPVPMRCMGRQAASGEAPANNDIWAEAVQIACRKSLT